MQSNHDIFRISGADDVVSEKITYLFKWFPKFGWETRIDAVGEIDQLASSALNRCAVNKVYRFILANDHSENASAYQIYESRSAKGSYRVVCTLSKIKKLIDPCAHIKEKIKSRMQNIIVEFLNDVHLPPVRSFSEWQIGNGVIFCKSASIGHASPGTSPFNLADDLNDLRSHFKYNAQQAGLKDEIAELFCDLLGIEDHKAVAFHYFFPLPSLYNVLYPVAEAYHLNKHAKCSMAVAKAVLKDKIPVADVLGKIGFYLTRFDIDSLGLVNKSGAEELKRNKPPL